MCPPPTIHFSPVAAFLFPLLPDVGLKAGPCDGMAVVGSSALKYHAFPIPCMVFRQSTMNTTPSCLGFTRLQEVRSVNGGAVVRVCDGGRVEEHAAKTRGATHKVEDHSGSYLGAEYCLDLFRWDRFFLSRRRGAMSNHCHFFWQSMIASSLQHMEAMPTGRAFRYYKLCFQSS